MALVYFTRKEKNFEKLLDESKILDFIEENDIVAIKLHVGEVGNKNHLNPELVKIISEKIKEKGAKPFLTDTSTYYKQRRNNAIDHMALAKEHGFDFAPFIQSDGLGTIEGIEIESKGILKKAYIAPLYEEVDKVLIMTHVTGHLLAGVGASIKNIAMGCATKKGKLEQHKAISLGIDKKKCTGCALCAKACSIGAVVIENGVRVHEKEKDCMNCPGCVDSCPNSAITLGDKTDLCRALASCAYSFQKLMGKEKIRYINVALAVTEKCDCAKGGSPILEKYIGIFASDDLVSIDKATFDSLKTDFEKLFSVSAFVQTSEAEKLGVGSQKYEIKEI